MTTLYHFTMLGSRNTPHCTTVSVHCVTLYPNTRALLRQGLVRLNLWPVLPESQKGSVSAQPSPMGSTAINPDGNTSTVLYVELDTYAHPVACPTHGWGEDMPMCVSCSDTEHTCVSICM